MRLTRTEFENELKYQGMMYFVRKMLREGLLSDSEFRRISASCAERFSPKTGELLARNDLLYRVA